MATIPTPRVPRCYKHHVFLASCLDCQRQRQAEREAAAKRIEKATR